MGKQKAPPQRNNNLFNQPRPLSSDSSSEASNPDHKGDPVKCFTRRSVEEHQARLAAKREMDLFFGIDSVLAE